MLQKAAVATTSALTTSVNAVTGSVCRGNSGTARRSARSATPTGISSPILRRGYSNSPAGLGADPLNAACCPRCSRRGRGSVQSTAHNRRRSCWTGCATTVTKIWRAAHAWSSHHAGEPNVAVKDLRHLNSVQLPVGRAVTGTLRPEPRSPDSARPYLQAVSNYAALVRRYSERADVVERTALLLVLPSVRMAAAACHSPG